MDEDSARNSLVPSFQNIVIRGSQRHSFPIAQNEFSMVLHDVSSLNESDLLNQTPERKNAFSPKTWEALSAIISILYGYALIALGLALPVSQLITKAIPREIYDMFYIYLYGGSLTFIITINILSLRKKVRKKFVKHCRRLDKQDLPEEEHHPRVKNHGSFYLRLGVSAFAMGSMVYSGLELGEHFISDRVCDNFILSATKPALRMLFTLLQIQFIFLSENGLCHGRFQGLIRISLAHMLGTNIAEWLAIVIEETKHEIHHINPHYSHHGGNTSNETNCEFASSGILIRNSTAYLFPCVIEYSLICAVTLMEIWKEIRLDGKVDKPKSSKHSSPTKSSSRQYYTVDCSKSEKGMSAGLVANVYTAISLIVYFSIRETQDDTARFSLNVCETVLHLSSILAMTIASYQMRNLAYCVHRLDSKGSMKMGLDITLLLKALAGVYMYCIFSLIACLFTPGASVWPDLISLAQSSVQTAFILDTWWKRCATQREEEKKPGRQCITFLRVVNLGLWIIAVTEKSRAELRPTQLEFYGKWPWTIITHVSMPLHVFYRFHSSICLFEIWRNSYRGIYVRPDEDIVF